MLVHCWASVEDGGPTLYKHWQNVSYLLGMPENTTRLPNAGSMLGQHNIDPAFGRRVVFAAITPQEATNSKSEIFSQ